VEKSETLSYEQIEAATKLNAENLDTCIGVFVKATTKVRQVQASSRKPTICFLETGQAT
jgi:hypothetical protein